MRGNYRNVLLYFFAEFALNITTISDAQLTSNTVPMYSTFVTGASDHATLIQDYCQLLRYSTINYHVPIDTLKQ